YYGAKSKNGPSLNHLGPPRFLTRPTGSNVNGLAVCLVSVFLTPSPLVLIAQLAISLWISVAHLIVHQTLPGILAPMKTSKTTLYAYGAPPAAPLTNSLFPANRRSVSSVPPCPFTALL